jgi:TetR/AcrR family transcriptional regulator
MEAGLELINEGGYNALRIEDIAARAGLSVGTFYLYFEGKSDLFVSLVQDYTGRLRDRLMSAGGRTATSRLARSFDAYLDFVVENEPAFLHFVRTAGSMQTNMGPLSTWALNSYAGDLEPGVREAVESGALRNLDPTLASQAIIGLAQHLAVFWIEHKDQYTREQFKDFVLNFIGYGLAGMPDRGGRT